MGIVIFIIVVIVLIFIWVEIDASNEKIAQKSFMDKYNIDPNNDKYLLFKLMEQYDMIKFEYWYHRKDMYPNLALKYNNCSLLMYAIIHDRDSFVPLLLKDYEINVNEICICNNPDGVFPLAQAVANGKVDVVEELLKRQDLVVDLLNKLQAGIESFAVSAINLEEKEQNVDKEKINNILKCVEIVMADSRYNAKGDLYDYDVNAYKLLEYVIQNNIMELFSLYKTKNFCNRGLFILDYITDNTDEKIINEIYKYAKETLIGLMQGKIVRYRYVGYFNLLDLYKLKESCSCEKCCIEKFNEIKKQEIKYLNYFESIVKKYHYIESLELELLELLKQTKSYFRKLKIDKSNNEQPQTKYLLCGEENDSIQSNNNKNDIVFLVTNKEGILCRVPQNKLSEWMDEQKTTINNQDDIELLTKQLQDIEKKMIIQAVKEKAIEALCQEKIISRKEYDLILEEGKKLQERKQILLKKLKNKED